MEAVVTQKEIEAKAIIAITRVLPCLRAADMSATEKTLLLVDVLEFSG